jgi:ferredoxin
MTVNMVIDGREISCEQDRTVLDVAKENGIEIPTLCHNPLYDEVRSGACRLCVVEIMEGGKPGLQSSCTLPVSEGLKISTASEEVFQARRTVVELMLSEHVQDCRNCFKSGDCEFARLCREYDINGVPVCAECPNRGQGCLLSRGVLCLGPITHAGCEAYCTSLGYKCDGCHTVMANEDVLRFGIRAYADAGFFAHEILEAAQVFSFDKVRLLEKLMREEGLE